MIAHILAGVMVVLQAKVLRGRQLALSGLDKICLLNLYDTWFSMLCFPEHTLAFDPPSHILAQASTAHKMHAKVYPFLIRTSNEAFAMPTWCLQAAPYNQSPHPSSLACLLYAAGDLLAPNSTPVRSCYHMHFKNLEVLASFASCFCGRSAELEVASVLACSLGLTHCPSYCAILFFAAMPCPVAVRASLVASCYRQRVGFNAIPSGRGRRRPLASE